LRVPNFMLFDEKDALLARYRPTVKIKTVVKEKKQLEPVCCTTDHFEID